MSEEHVITDATIVKPIALDDARGRWEFDPQPDITPYEAVLISQLFSAMLLRVATKLDWREYLTRDRHPVIPIIGVTGKGDGLPRHFKKFD